MLQIFDNLPTITSLIGSILICEASYHFSGIFFIWSLLNSYASFYYHYTHEICCKNLDVIVSGISLIYVYICLYYHQILINSLDLVSLSLAFFYLGRSWTNCRPRKANYTINHSLFHIFISIGMRRIILRLHPVAS